MRAISKVSALLLGVLLVVSGSALAEVVLANQDASGNGHDLTEVGSPEQGDSSGIDRFGDGYLFDTSDGQEDFLENTDAALQTTGDLSALAAFHPSTDGLGGPLGVWAGDGSGALTVSSEGTSVEYLYETPATGSNSVVVSLPPWAQDVFLSAWVTRDVGALNTDVSLEVFAANGTSVGKVSGTFSTGPAGNSPSNAFRVGSRTASIGFNGSIYEVRFWTSVVAEGVLDGLADPTDPSNQFELEGSEEAAWFLERFTQAGDPDAENSVSVYTPDHAVVGENVTVYGQARNLSAEPLEPDNGFTFTVTRLFGGLSDPVVQYWDGSGWSVKPSQFVGVGIGGDNATLFKAELGQLPAEDNVHVLAWTVLPPGGEGGQNVNVTGSATFPVYEESVTVAGHTVPNVEPYDSSQTSFLILVLAALIFAAYNGWVVPAFASLAAIAHPMFEQAGVAYPFDFTAFVLLYAVGIALHMALARFGSMRDGRGSLEGE